MVNIRDLDTVNGDGITLYQSARFALAGRKTDFRKDIHDLVDGSGLYASKEEAIGAVMDLESVVDTYIIEEVMGNYDRGNGSFYMCVDFSKKAKYDRLTFMAPWDFNWCAIGKQFIAGTFYGITDAGRFKECVHPWFVLLMKEDWFRQRVAKRWDELYSTGVFRVVIDECADMVKAAEPDFSYYGKKVTKRNSYRVALETTEKLTERVDWLNKEIMKWLSE